MKTKRRMPLTRSEIMKRVKHKDSAAELALRSALHSEGLRFRLQRCYRGYRLSRSMNNTILEDVSMKCEEAGEKLAHWIMQNGYQSRYGYSDNIEESVIRKMPVEFMAWLELNEFMRPRAKFEPFLMSFRINSEREAIALWHRLNLWHYDFPKSYLEYCGRSISYSIWAVR